MSISSSLAPQKRRLYTIPPLLSIVCLIICLFSSIAPYSSAENISSSTLPKARYVTSAEVKAWQKMDKSIEILDVREPKEFDMGHIQDAINIPYAQAEEKLKELDRNGSYVFYCIHSSWRAPYVANLAADLGYEKSYILEGGIAAWNAEGQELIAADPSKTPQVAEYPKELPKVLKTPPLREYKTKINLTVEQLSEFDGKNGRPAYVAVDRVIYDLTQSRLWRGGEHDPSHGKVQAGCDLTEVIKESPHGKKHLERFPVVGYLVSQESK